MKRTYLSIALASALAVTACNSASDNAKNDSTGDHKADTAITTDSRRNAPGTYDVTTDTGNKTQTIRNDKDPGTTPTKPMNQ